MKTKMNFTEKQIQWASEHDWFISGNGNQIVGRAWEFRSDDERHFVTFTSWNQLRDWAGY